MPQSDDLPVLQAYSYRMAGRVRPLLFWISRDRVGSGLIVWRRAEGGAAYELLIGTDPATAPRAVNRWGYIMEDVRSSGARIFGVITTAEESTISAVRQKAAKDQPPGRFKAIDAWIDSRGACATTATFDTERDHTLQEVSDLVRRVHERLASVPPKDVRMPAGVRPGFLTAVAELVTDTMTARRDGAAAMTRLKGRTIPYIYGPDLLDMSLTGLDSVDPARRPPGPSIARDARDIVTASFEARSRATGERYRFELDYATTGPLAGVPLTIRYQPRWWLQAELTIEDESTRLASLQRTGHPVPAPARAAR